MSGIFQVPFGWFAICGGLNLTQATSRTNERWCLSNFSWFTSNDIPILNSCRLDPIFAIYVWVSWSLRAGWASPTRFNVGKSCSTFGFMELLREFLPIHGFFAFLVFLFSSQGENERWKKNCSQNIYTPSIFECAPTGALCWLTGVFSNTLNEQKYHSYMLRDTLWQSYLEKNCPY